MSMEQVSEFESDDSVHRSQLRLTVGGPGADIGGLHNRAIDAAIAYISNRGGGVVELTEGEFAVHDAIYLQSSVTLRGQGSKTVLKKCAALRTSLLVDADAHECVVDVAEPTGFEVGMGVTIGDERNAIRDRCSVRTITWKSGNTLGFGRSFESTQMVQHGAFVQVTFPVIYGLEVENVAVENLSVDGSSEQNPIIDSWADGGIYLLRVRGARLANCDAYNLSGDGISLNTSHVILIEECRARDNARLGVHIGGGSQRTVVRNCRIVGNRLRGYNRDGLYLCFSAQHGVYEGNVIVGNLGAGISIGHKDGDNLFENNVIRGNSQAGVFYRTDTYRTYGNVFRNCVIEDNGDEVRGHGFYVAGDAHHLVLENCTIRDTRPQGSKLQRIGLSVGPGVQDVVAKGCTVEGNAEQDIRWSQEVGA